MEQQLPLLRILRLNKLMVMELLKKKNIQTQRRKTNRSKMKKSIILKQ
jgi:hypothetical protein